MPIPVWLPIALAGASLAANQQAARKVNKARDRAYAESMRQNEEERRKAMSAADRTRQQYENQGQKQADAAAQYAEDLKAGQGDIYATVAPSSQAGTVAPMTDRLVEDARDRAQGTRRYTNSLADALGAMRGFDQAFLDAGLAARNNMTDIMQAQGNMRGNQRVLEARLRAANEKGAGWGTLGDLLSMGAMITTPAALAAGGGAAAGTEAAKAGIQGGASITATGAGLLPGTPAPQMSLALPWAPQAAVPWWKKMGFTAAPFAAGGSK